MTAAPLVLYNTNLSKAQGLVPETLELLGLWRPGMTALDLTARVKETGALGRATSTRVNDVISRGFAQRFLIDGGKPAEWLLQLMEEGANRAVIRQIILIFTARHNPVFHDFITTVYWRRAATASAEVSKADTRDFLERAVLTGRIHPRWADSMMERVTRYLLGTLADFQLIRENSPSRRQVTPPAILEETVLFLAHELHFRGIEDRELPRHPDWALFGLGPDEVVRLLERAAFGEHLQIQNAGQILRIEWKYPDMKHVLHAITH